MPPKTPEPIVYDLHKELEGYPDTPEDKNFLTFNFDLMLSK